MQLQFLLLVVLPFPHRAQAGDIIGGHEAKPHSRPYMASLTIHKGGNASNRCGGFLIREDVVVTAAHCNCNLGNISVLLGAHNLSMDELGTQNILVQRRIPHPQFSDATFENDIMLLQLQRKAKLSRAVDVIPLPHHKVKTGDVCSVAGWGQKSINSSAPATSTLQEVELKNLDGCMCLPGLYPQFVPSRMLCGGDPQKRKGPFRGDSGGPLVCDGKAQGIVSYGKDNLSVPSVFTKLSKYVCWIRKTLHKLKP